MTRKHPIQKVRLDDRGVARFTENEIVSFLLEQYKPGLNDLAVRFYDNTADYEQLMMLIGYSVSGFGDLSRVERRTVAAADAKVKRLLEDAA